MRGCSPRHTPHPHTDLDLPIALADVTIATHVLCRAFVYVVFRDEMPTRLERHEASGWRAVRARNRQAGQVRGLLF
jgi:hypothetical protein